MNVITENNIIVALFLCFLVMRANGFKPKKKFHIQGRTFSALDATTFNKLPKLKASALLDLLFMKKLKLQKDKKSRKKKQSLSAFKENYQHWLKTRERN